MVADDKILDDTFDKIRINDLWYANKIKFCYYDKADDIFTTSQPGYAKYAVNALIQGDIQNDMTSACVVSQIINGDAVGVMTMQSFTILKMAFKLGYEMGLSDHYYIHGRNSTKFLLRRYSGFRLKRPPRASQNWSL